MSTAAQDARTDFDLRAVTREDTDWLVCRYRETGEEVYASALARLHDGLACARAARMAHRGVDHDELRQVARESLWKALLRYDPEHPASFSTYATRCIDGGLKRYFRDQTWAVRVPRGLKDLAAGIPRVQQMLSATLGRSPTLAELAAELGSAEDVVEEALHALNGYRADSLDAPARNRQPDSPTLAASLPDEHEDHRADLLTILEGIHGLPEKQCKAMLLRFFHDLTQSEIADELGCSQMHVSRLLRRAVATLRNDLAPG